MKHTQSITHTRTGEGVGRRIVKQPLTRTNPQHPKQPYVSAKEPCEIPQKSLMKFHRRAQYNTHTHKGRGGVSDREAAPRYARTHSILNSPTFPQKSPMKFRIRALYVTHTHEGRGGVSDREAAPDMHEPTAFKTALRFRKRAL